MGAGSILTFGTFFSHREMVVDRVFSIGKAKFSPVALIDTITNPTEAVFVDFCWSEENTKEMRQAGIEPAPEGRENFLVLKRGCKKPPPLV